MVSVIEEFHCIASYIHPFTFWFSRVYSLAQDLKTHGGSGSRKSQAWAWNEPQNYIHSYGFRTMLLQRKREFSFQQPIFYLRFRWVNVYYMHGRFNKDWAKNPKHITAIGGVCHGASRRTRFWNPCTGFHVDFGFQIGFLMYFTWISGFLDFKVDFYIIFIVDLDFWAGPGAKATCIWCINICINKYTCMTYCTRHLGKWPCTQLKIGRVQRSLLCTDVKCYYVIQNPCTPV